jgi:hypothetical protein
MLSHFPFWDAICYGVNTKLANTSHHVCGLNPYYYWLNIQGAPPCIPSGNQTWFAGKSLICILWSSNLKPLFVGISTCHVWLPCLTTKEYKPTFQEYPIFYPIKTPWISPLKSIKSH